MVRKFLVVLIIIVVSLSSGNLLAMRRAFSAQTKQGSRFSGLVPHVVKRNNIATPLTLPRNSRSNSSHSLVKGNIQFPRIEQKWLKQPISRTMIITGAGTLAAPLLLYGVSKYGPIIPSFFQKDFSQASILKDQPSAPTKSKEEMLAYIQLKKNEFDNALQTCFISSDESSFAERLQKIIALLEDESLMAYAGAYPKEMNNILTNNPDAGFSAELYTIQDIISALKKAQTESNAAEIFVQLKDILSIFPGDLQKPSYVAALLKELTDKAIENAQSFVITHSSSIEEWNQTIDTWKINNYSENKNTPELTQALKNAKKAPTVLLKAYELRAFLPQLSPTFAADQKTKEELETISYLKQQKDRLDKEIRICLGILDTFDDETLKTEEFEKKNGQTWEAYFDSILNSFKDPKTQELFKRYPVEAQEIFSPNIPQQYLADYRLEYTKMISILENVRNIKQSRGYKIWGVIAVGIELRYFFYYLPEDLQPIVIDKSSKRITNGAKKRLSIAPADKKESSIQ